VNKALTVEVLGGIPFKMRSLLAVQINQHIIIATSMKEGWDWSLI